jgi:hypothetical protein
MKSPEVPKMLPGYRDDPITKAKYASLVNVAGIAGVITSSLALSEVGVVTISAFGISQYLDDRKRLEGLHQYLPIPNTMNREAFAEALKSDVFYRMVTQK